MVTTENAGSPSALEVARALAARGWRPFPLDHPSLPVCAGTGRKCRENREKLGDCKPKDRGKHPVNVWSTQTASPPPDPMLKIWFGDEARNIGLAAGPSGLLIIDEDEQDALTALAADQGEELPTTYRVLTSRGWHWYFLDPDNEFGNSAGALEAYGCDVRGGHGAGGYVVAAGSTHHTGVEYVAEDDHAEVAPLPEWIKKLLRMPAAGKGKGDGEQPMREGPWTSEPRYGYPDELRGQYDRHLAAVRALAPQPGRKPNGGQFRHTLFLAALDGWRLVRCGLADEISMLNEIRRAIEAVWGAPPDDDDRHIVYTEAQEKAAASPWRALDPSMSPSESSGADGDDPESDADALERKIAERVETLRVDHLARLRWAAEQRAHRPSIADGVLDDLDAIEPPAMLLGSLIPEDAVGFLAGRSGAYKSFLAVAWACCIATGTPWLGRDEFATSRPLKTLYVAAEGAAGAAGRIKAWEAFTGVSRKGQLLLYPRAIHLNDPAQIAELTEYVVQHEIRFLVIDTYHRSAPGTEENSSTDFGIVFEAAAALRDDHECASLFIDHTGAGKSGNPRGTSAKRDDADYVLSASYLGEGATPDAQREMWVTKLKDADTTGRWPVRLTEVDGQKFPVIEIGTVEIATPFGNVGDDFGDWWQVDRLPDMPEKVADAIAREAAKDRNRGLDAARWTWRFMAIVNDPDGLTSAAIAKALEAVPRPRPITRAAVLKALPMLERAGVVGRDKTRVWLEQSALPERS